MFSQIVLLVITNSHWIPLGVIIYSVLSVCTASVVAVDSHTFMTRYDFIIECFILQFSLLKKCFNLIQFRHAGSFPPVLEKAYTPIIPETASIP